MNKLFSKLLGTGIKDAAEGVVTLGKGIRTIITGHETMDNQTKVALEQLIIDADKVENQLVEIEQRLPIAVNATMVAEAQSEHWPQYSWRPFWGFISGFAFLLVVIMICVIIVIAVRNGKAEILGIIPAIISAFTALFAIPGAILGVSAWHRGKQKREQTAGDMDNIIKVLKELKTDESE